MSDELAWQQQLLNHLYLHLAPSFPAPPPCTVTELHSTVVATLRNLFSQFPVEYAVLTIKMLVEQFKNSFRVDLRSSSRGEPNPSQHVSASLPPTPVLLLALLVADDKPGSTGELLARDATAAIVCEVCHTNLPLHYIGNLVLFVTWNFVYCSSSKCRSYLEVQEVVPLCQQAPPTSCLKSPPTSCLQAPPAIDHHTALSVSALQQSLREKDFKKRRFDVCGRVTAVGEVVRNGQDHLFLLQLADSESDTAVCNVVIQDPSLLHLASLLHISEEYVFTRLRDMVLNKGAPDAKRVLASSPETRVHRLNPFSPPPSNPQMLKHIPLEPSSPPKKKLRQQAMAAPSEVSDTGSLELCSDRLGSCGDRAINWSPGIEHESCPLVSYRGTVTRIVLPEFGLYELDDRIRLYLTHRECLDQCRGVRCGAMLELHNAHVMKISVPHLKCTSGFYCCPLTTARVVQFSALDSPFHGFHPRGRFHVLAKNYRAMDVAWMTEVYTSLRHKEERPDLRTSLALLDHTLHLSGAALLETSAHAVFLSLPHRCPLLEPVDLSPRPCVPSLAEFLEHVQRKVASESFRWWGGGEEEGNRAGSAESSSALQFAMSAQWTFGRVMSSEFSTPQFLIGCFQGNGHTGYIELADSSASLPVVCCVPSKRASKTQPRGIGETQPGGTGKTQSGGTGKTQPGGLLMQFGSKVLIDQFSVFVEKMTEAGNSGITAYLHAKDCRFAVPGKQEKQESLSSSVSPLMMSPSSRGAASVQQSGGSAVSKNRDSHIFYFVVLNKNALRANPAKGGLPTSCLFTVQTLLHTNPEVLINALPPQKPHVDDSQLQKHMDWGPHGSRPHTHMDQGPHSSRPHTHVDHGSKEPVAAQSRPALPLRVVLDFPPTSLHWYSYICSGCLYSLSAPATTSGSGGAGGLPSLELLRSEPCVVVEEGVEIQLVEAALCSNCCTPVEDISELVSRLYLPRFSTTSGTPTAASPPGGDQDLVSLTGLLLQHSYRVDVEALSSGRLMTVAHTSPESLPSKTTAFPRLPHTSSPKILALKIRSLRYPDTLMVYFDLKGGVPPPLGLLPGAVVTLRGMRAKFSRSGNVYCTNCASSSIDINSLEGVGTNFHGISFPEGVSTNFHSSTRGVPPEMRNLPTSSLHVLMTALLCGRLSRKMVCVRGTFVSVQQVSLQLICRGCQCTVVDGNCMASCLQKRPVLRAEARFIVEDGSAEAHVYLGDGLVPQALGVAPSEWAGLLDLVEKTGQVLYNKPTASRPVLQVGGVQSPGLSAKERAQLKLAELASCPSLYQTAVIYCQPFVSSAELKESVLGQKSHLVRLGAAVEYHTLALPRLQLRAIVLSRPVNCTAECERLLAELERLN